MSKAGEKLIKAARDMRVYARGEPTEGFVLYEAPHAIDVKKLRRKLGMSQLEFSGRFGFSIDAVQDWEQKRRQPDRAARVLLTVIAYEPDAVTRALIRAR